MESATKVGYAAMGGVAANDVKVESREVRGKGAESFVRIQGRGLWIAVRCCRYCGQKAPENKNRARRRGYSQSEKIKTPSPPKAKFELSRSSEIKNQHCLV